MSNIIDPPKSNFRNALIAVIAAFFLGLLVSNKYFESRKKFNPAIYVVERKASSKPKRQIKQIADKKVVEVPSSNEISELSVEDGRGLIPASTKPRFYYEPKRLSQLSEPDLRKNIELADSLIREDKDHYDAYKAKLLSLVALEVKHGVSVSLDEYDALYDELLQFEWAERSEEGADELNGIDESLIHIPFLRLSALRKLDTLGELSEEYIEEFPESHIGYIYLAEAHFRNGDTEFAEEVSREAANVLSRDEIAEGILSRINEDPLQRLMGL